MTITKEEKRSLTLQGYSRTDINEIIRAARKTSYFLVCGQQRLTIPESEAVERLGREEWLKGITRSAFHIDTTRHGLNGEMIHMHSKVYA